MAEAIRTLAPDSRVLIVRLGSMGDIVHALPAVAALRRRFPQVQMDWLVERKWAALVESTSVASNVLPLDRDSWGALWQAIRGLRRNRYDWAIDLQGLYKSAVCAWLSGARRRIGHSQTRESGASQFYTLSVATILNRHVAHMHLSLANVLGATDALPVFPEFTVPAAAEAFAEAALAEHRLERFYVLSPGGGWRSKLWPAEQYGHLHRRVAERFGLRAVVSFGPGEKALAESVRLVAGEPSPVVLGMDIPQLIAVLRRCEFFVGADTGPLHLAAAVGRPVVALFGPTDPRRNGPLGTQHIVIRNVGDAETTYRRGENYSPAMQSIRVEQVLDAVGRLLGNGRHG
jgi:lipopolysaccharide heptosyltransferase I